MGIESYEDLEVWQLAVRLATGIEGIACRLPRHEQHGLAAQLRRASTSIPFNIAEGWARPTRAYLYHLRVALGSEAELKTALVVTMNLKLIPRAEVEPLLASASQVGRMMNGLVKSLRRHLPGPRPPIPDPRPPIPDPYPRAKIKGACVRDWRRRG